MKNTKEYCLWGKYYFANVLHKVLALIMLC